MIFCIKLSPSHLKDIITYKRNRQVLKDTLQHLGFEAECAEIMSASP